MTPRQLSVGAFCHLSVTSSSLLSSFLYYLLFLRNPFLLPLLFVISASFFLPSPLCHICARLSYLSVTSHQTSHYFVMTVLVFRYLLVATRLITTDRHSSIASPLLSLQRLRSFCPFRITRLPSSSPADHHPASSSVALFSLPSRVAPRHHPKIIFLRISYLSL